MSAEPSRSGRPATEPAVLIERRDRVLVITLNRPAARNAVNGELAAGLEAAVDELEGDDDLWAAVLTGTGPVFCAGADLKSVAMGRADDLTTARGGFAGFVRRRRDKPVVAALAGHALAGGMELAIAADLIVAGHTVTLGIPETARSLLAVGGGLAELPRLLGEKAALELALTAAPWPASRFAELGLISRIVDDATHPEHRRDDNCPVLTEAVALATAICANAPLAVRASRRAILDGRDLDTSARWALAEEELAELACTSDFCEGPRAFVEKRAPRWSGH